MICIRCHRPLLLAISGRTICERCRLAGGEPAWPARTQQATPVHVEPPLHRPRPCPTCRELSRAVIDGRCLTCRTVTPTAAEKSV